MLEQSLRKKIVAYIRNRIEPNLRLRFNVLSIDFVRVTTCFYDYDYD